MEKQFLIDSHAHVQFPAYDADRDEVMQRAHEDGIGVVNIGTQYSTSEDAVRLADQHPGWAWATVGFHPNHIDHEAHYDPQELRERSPEVFEIEKFRNLVHHPKVVAIGECGLDYYRIRNYESGIMERQKEVFRHQIELAKEVRKPLVIHCRSAFTDLVRFLTPITLHPTPYGNGVVHFFSGSWEDAQNLIDLGFYLGFGGVITFARDYDEVVTKAPLDRILVETDAPYVAPVPWRGKRNEPAYIVETVKKIADLRSIRYDEVARVTYENTKRLFRI
ncbi:MAG: TatD family hydrolase [Candidatus Sungbacteria bacterium]|uniref:TatD family hydrolase n=1 Tax=Candidatus Sungiibacteriota bacterium TaxID=2750080 RepID=A0A932YX63_9BACT|nr:TatD family hydrolase [Candidatus Sungbacteria bacterium]